MELFTLKKLFRHFPQYDNIDLNSWTRT